MKNFIDATTNRYIPRINAGYSWRVMRNRIGVRSFKPPLAFIGSWRAPKANYIPLVQSGELNPVKGCMSHTISSKWTRKTLVTRSQLKQILPNRDDLISPSCPVHGDEPLDRNWHIYIHKRSDEKVNALSQNHNTLTIIRISESREIEKRKKSSRTSISPYQDVIRIERTTRIDKRI